MKWKATIKEKPQFGDTRMVTKFAWFPTLVMESIYVWLEKYQCIQTWVKRPTLRPSGQTSLGMWCTYFKKLKSL